jgi:hypothetical protein
MAMLLTKVLQRGKIWCVNIGETHKVSNEAWNKFAIGLRDTNVTHMYASEHYISSAMKDKLRGIMRENRKGHRRHSDVRNLAVIAQCTHCWWNPINAKALRAAVEKKGLAKLLSSNMVNGGKCLLKEDKKKESLNLKARKERAAKRAKK